ncbi:hypothetical protein [Chthoniobacter flavus]|nr:hypothetical protein [Chthoniobacter flavus]
MAEAPFPNIYPEPDPAAPSPSLFVATLFEDQTTADCAQRLMCRILEMADQASPVQDYAWGLQVFDQPDGMAAAARRAAAADVLVVAAYRDSPALHRIVEWLQRWLSPLREKRGALVAVIIEQGEAGHTVSRNEELLAPIAREIDMDFFSTRVSPSAEFPRGTIPHPSSHDDPG